MDTEHLHKRIIDFFRRPELEVPLRLLRRELPRRAEVYVLGGALRNILIGEIHGEQPPIGDIDLFLNNLDPAYPLDRLFATERHEMAELGGIRWYPPRNPFRFDVCMISDFIGIKTFGLAPGIQTLLDTTDFSVNAITYNVATHEIMERKSIDSIRERMIHFNSERIVNRTMLAYRIFAVRHKINFLLAEPVFGFIKRHLDLDTQVQFKACLSEKLSPEMNEAVLADYRRITGYPNYEVYLAGERPRLG